MGAESKQRNGRTQGKRIIELTLDLTRDDIASMTKVPINNPHFIYFIKELEPKNPVVVPLKERKEGGKKMQTADTRLIYRLNVRPPGVHAVTGSGSQSLSQDFINKMNPNH